MVTLHTKRDSPKRFNHGRAHRHNNQLGHCTTRLNLGGNLRTCQPVMQPWAIGIFLERSGVHTQHKDSLGSIQSWTSTQKLVSYHTIVRLFEFPGLDELEVDRFYRMLTPSRLTVKAALGTTKPAQHWILNSKTYSNTHWRGNIHPGCTQASPTKHTLARWKLMHDLHNQQESSSR